jgi:hypothetical protein
MRTASRQTPRLGHPGDSCPEETTRFLRSTVARRPRPARRYHRGWCHSPSHQNHLTESGPSMIRFQRPSGGALHEDRPLPRALTLPRGVAGSPSHPQFSASQPIPVLRFRRRWPRTRSRARRKFREERPSGCCPFSRSPAEPVSHTPGCVRRRAIVLRAPSRAVLEMNRPVHRAPRLTESR